MKVIVFFALLGLCYGQNLRYVFDAMRIFDANEVATMLASAQPGKDYPNYNSIPASAQNYDCNGKQGFYADVSTQCQVFHRCDINGNHTAYICVNTTVFNQVTLVCDYYYNVDCSKSKAYETFANSRLYTDQPLFDTPPADYVVPAMAAILAKQGTSAEGRAIDSGSQSNQVSPGKGNKPAPKPASKPVKPAPRPAAGKATTTTTTAATTEAAGGEATTAAAGETTTGAAGEAATTAAGGDATTAAAGGEATTAAAAGDETTAAAAGESTTAAAGGDETTTAAGGESTTAAAGGDETTAAAGGDATTAAAGGDTTTAAAGGDETTAAAGGDETTAAAGGDETTTAAA